MQKQELVPTSREGRSCSPGPVRFDVRRLSSDNVRNSVLTKAVDSSGSMPTASKRRTVIGSVRFASSGEKADSWSPRGIGAAWRRG